jgi:hypothetical protein
MYALGLFFLRSHCRLQGPAEGGWGVLKHEFHIVVIVSLMLLPGVKGEPLAGQMRELGRPGQRIDVDIHGGIYLVDRERNSVARLAPDLHVEREVGGAGWGNDQFDRPSGIWARNGIDVFVSDEGNHRIQRFDGRFNYVCTYSTQESDNPGERFRYPSDVAVSRFSDLYICDSENSRIVKLDAQGNFSSAFGGIDAGKGRLQGRDRIGIGPDDRIYVLDGGRIVEFDAFGNFHGILAEGVLRGPSLIYADPLGVIVAESDTLYCFDAVDRPVSSLPIATIVGGPSQCFSIAAAGGTLYLLTERGLARTPDPRVSPMRNPTQRGPAETPEAR